jgi:hypothetical protein
MEVEKVSERRRLAMFCTYKCSIQARSPNHVSPKKQQLLNITSDCLYSCLTYTARKAYAFCAVIYCHLWSLLHYHIFPHYLINGIIFGKKSY